MPGIGYDCIAQWLQPPGTADEHVRKYGYELQLIKVDALSGTTNNARQIRDAVMAMDLGPGAPRLVLVGYSKGTPDVLEAIVNYPEIRASRGRRGERGGRSGRLAAGQRRRAVPGRSAAPLSRRDLRCR